MHTRPRPVEGLDVRAWEPASARVPEALARYVQVPHVEVRHLGAFDRRDAEDLTRAYRPGATGAPRDDELLDAPAAVGAREARVEITVDLERRPGFGFVDDPGLHVFGAQSPSTPLIVHLAGRL